MNPIHSALRLQIFDQAVAVESDDPNFINLLNRMYQHLLAGDNTGPAWPVSLNRTADGGAVMRLGDDRLHLDDARLLEGFAYERLVYAVLARVRSHFLAHAGVVAHAGRGVIVAGEAGHGKTTLTLELVRRGFQFLSDELAAIDRATGRLSAFPRALRLRADTLRRVGFHLAGEAGWMWQEKLLLDLDELAPGQRVQEAALAAVVILKGAGDAADPAAPLFVRVGELPAGFLAAISALPGVTRATVVGADRYPLIEIETTARLRALEAVEQVCRERGVRLLDAILRPASEPSFEGPARLTPLTATEAATQLMAHFQGGHHSRLLSEDFGGRPGRMLLELARLIAPAQCFALSLGPLTEMAGQIEALKL